MRGEWVRVRVRVRVRVSDRDRASAALLVSGFSHSTCLPARSAAAAHS